MFTTRHGFRSWWPAQVSSFLSGFFEWENPSEERFGTDQLAEIVQQFSDREPKIIIAELYEAVISFSQGTPQKDDLTAVLIKRVPVQSSN